MKQFESTFLAKHKQNHARIMKIKTPHGEVTTPMFMPVGTRAGVNCMMPRDLHRAGAQIILGGNTYHMLVAPGMEVIKHAGGMHAFMGWNKPMLTDSGGFQVFSLSKNANICTIDEQGAHFKHPQTGNVVHMSPEVSLEAQKIIGADIIMAFDQCTPDDLSYHQALKIMQRTHRWLQKSKDYQERYPHSVYGHKQALFGIVQGGVFQKLRERSAEFINTMDCDGIAIGGETIGFDMQKTAEIINWVRPIFPQQKIRYSMGVGLCPQDLIDVVKQGIDIFDCVAPTRNARHGSLYSGLFVERDGWLHFDSEFQGGRLPIKKAVFAADERPVMADCACYTCQNHSRAELHYLLKQHAIAYSALACTHNIHVMLETCKKLQEIIAREC